MFLDTSMLELECLTEYTKAEGETDEALATRINAIKAECIDKCRASDAQKTKAFFAKGDALGKAKPQLTMKDFEEVVIAGGLGSITTADNYIRAARKRFLRENQDRLPRSDAAKIDMAAWTDEECNAYLLSGRMQPGTSRQEQKEWIEEHRRLIANWVPPSQQSAADEQSEGASDDAAPTVTPADDDDDETEQLSDIALDRLAQQAPRIGFQNLPGAFPVTDTGFALLLVQKDLYDTVIHGSLAHPDLIAAVAERLAADDLIMAGRQFRPLVETIMASSFPLPALPAKTEERGTWLCEKYPDPFNLPGLDPKTRSHKALHLDRGVITFCNAGMNASVVVRCVPARKPLFEDENNLHLDQVHVTNIVRWMDTDEIAGMRAGAARSSDAGYDLPVNNRVTGEQHVLTFNRNDLTTPPRPDIERDKFEALWEATVDHDWLTAFDRKWTSPWFNEWDHGKHNHILRPKNRTLGVTITAKDLTIEYNRREGMSDKKTFTFPSPININRRQTSDFLSKDLAPVLYRLARANVTGAIEIAGNAHVMVIRYNTMSGAFEIAIPAILPDQDRDSTMFKVVGGRNSGARSRK
jgi:hypothetical protein